MSDAFLLWNSWVKYFQKIGFWILKSNIWISNTITGILIHSMYIKERKILHHKDWIQDNNSLKFGFNVQVSFNKVNKSSQGLYLSMIYHRASFCVHKRRNYIHLQLYICTIPKIYDPVIRCAFNAQFVG